MKLSNQTRGPITLSRIDYSPRLSEETLAFAADITVVVDGQTLKGTVRNEGHGGDNHISPTAVHEAVDAYAKTLPKLVDAYFPNGLAYSYDLLISEMIGAAVEAQEHAKYVKKGYTHAIFFGDSQVLYSKGEPSPATIAKLVGPNAEKTVKVVHIGG